MSNKKLKQSKILAPMDSAMALLHLVRQTKDDAKRADLLEAMEDTFRAHERSELGMMLSAMVRADRPDTVKHETNYINAANLGYFVKSQLTTELEALEKAENDERMQSALRAAENAQREREQAEAEEAHAAERAMGEGMPDTLAEARGDA